MTDWEMRFAWTKALETPVANISIKDLPESQNRCVDCFSFVNNIWMEMPANTFPQRLGICFPSLQLKGSHQCQYVPIGIPQFIWMNRNQATVSSRTLCILDTSESKSNLCSYNYISQQEDSSNNLWR